MAHQHLPQRVNAHFRNKNLDSKSVLPSAAGHRDSETPVTHTHTHTHTHTAETEVLIGLNLTKVTKVFLRESNEICLWFQFNHTLMLIFASDQKSRHLSIDISYQIPTISTTKNQSSEIHLKWSRIYNLWNS